MFFFFNIFYILYIYILISYKTRDKGILLNKLDDKILGSLQKELTSKFKKSFITKHNV